LVDGFSREADALTTICGQSRTANAVQHNAYDVQPDTNSRQSQQFSNYLLDQTVVSDDQARHGSVSNAAASALILNSSNT